MIIFSSITYYVQIHVEFTIIYSQIGILGNKETNKYETSILPAGQYKLLAKTLNALPYNISFTLSNVQVNNVEVKPNQSYNSEEILIRSEDVSVI